MISKEHMEEFTPKRAVNNRKSEFRPHIMGAFFSIMMGTQIEFESLGEFVFLMICELSQLIYEFYPQPVEIPVWVYNKAGQLVSWPHIPDVLIFRKNMKPCLVQIKGATAVELGSPRYVNIDRACFKYAQERGWDYLLLVPRKASRRLRLNIELVFGFREKRNNNMNIIDKIIKTLKEHTIMTIDELANIDGVQLDRIYILPEIYHALAAGIIQTEMHKKLGLTSKIWLPSESDYEFYDYIHEME